MARTILQIYDEIVAELQLMSSLTNLQPNIHNSQTLLSDITTTSKVAIWRLMLWVVSFGIYIHEQVFEKHKKEITAKAEEIISGTSKWYRDQCLLFQLGDSLQWINNKYQYLVINAQNQVIKRAAVIEAGGQVRLKIAKLNGQIPTPLTLSELNAFQSYINKIKFAGTDITITSAVADTLKLKYNIIYDPLILDSSGGVITSPTTKPVETTIVNFITNLTFNGKLVLAKLTDAIQLIDGVVDVELILAEAKFGALPYSTIVRDYIADAGHLMIDPAFPLSTNITYINNV